MKVLAIKQPWASLIAEGIKTVEVRSRPTNIRERVAIYASRSPWDEGTMGVAHKYLDDWYAFPEGMIIATAEIVGSSEYESGLGFIGDSENHLIPLDDPESFVGFHGWELANIQKLNPRIGYKMPKGCVVWANADI